MSTPIRVACVGAGYFSRFHYDAWSRIDGAVAVASINRDLKKAQATGLPAYDDLDVALAEVKPDLLDIITPPPTHLDYVTRAIAHGVKAIICQKPFCENIEQALEATHRAAAAGIPIIVHENFRFQPWYRAMRGVMDSGRLGDVHQLTFRLRTGDGQGPDAYLDRQPYFQEMPKLLVHETAVHWVDTFRYLMGEPETVFADLRRMNPTIKGEDAGYIVFGYAGGVRALFDGNRHLDHSTVNPRITFGEALLEGTKGTVTLLGDGSVQYRAFGAQECDVVLPAQSYPGFAGDCVHALQSHVISGLQNGTPFENEASAYLRIVELEDAIYSSDADSCVKKV